jgi:hypothetical protein
VIATSDVVGTVHYCAGVHEPNEYLLKIAESREEEDEEESATK